MTMINNDIETPAFVVNEATALANISNFQAHCNKAGLALRPHIKTHKSIHFTRKQIEAGALGITCQKIGEAEVMADAGIDDILITFNIIGTAKLKRLVALSELLKSLKVTADNLSVIKGLNAAYIQADKTIEVLIECDTGAGRCGVQSADEAAALAREVRNLPGLTFAGLMTYPNKGDANAAAKFMQDTVYKLKQHNMDCPVVSTGGTPDMWQAGTLDIFTEYRIGTYIYNDRSLLACGTCNESDCAAYVLATVVSMPTPERAVIDAGSKVLTSDLLGLEGHGHVIAYPDATIVALSEEHGVLQINPDCGLIVGDRIRIIPNHVCVVSNMFDSVWLDVGKGGLMPMPIDARGRVT